MKLSNLAAVIAATFLFVSSYSYATQEITVYKSPTCGCCNGWVDYLRNHGFEVKTHDLPSLHDIKREHGVTSELQSCHTAIIDNYVIEGHVPVNDIKRLLAEKPSIAGLSAPGMPNLSPGMNSLIPKDYDVLQFSEDGTVEVFSSY